MSSVESCNGYQGLPKVSEETFNRLWTESYPNDAIKWESLQSSEGVIDPDEISVLASGQNLEKFVVDGQFTGLFNHRYAEIIEKARREAVQAEVNKTEMVVIPVELSQYNLTIREIKFVRQMEKIAPVVDELYQMQLGSYKYREQLLNSDFEADRLMMEKYQRPWCEASFDPICNALTTFDAHSTPMYPDSIKVDQLVGDLAAPFTVVEETKGEYQAVPYSQSFLSEKMGELKEEVAMAATMADEMGDEYLANYLWAIADSLSSKKTFPNVEPDEAWLAMKGQSKFYVRIAPDEVGWHKWSLKAGFNMVFGIINPEASKSVGYYKDIRQQIEHKFAEVIGSPYKERKVDISLPDFIDVIIEAGDAKGNVMGAWAAQTLPNWCGEDGAGKECKHRTMLFFNKTSRGYSPEVLRHYGQILSDESMKNFDPEVLKSGMVDHEFAHNMGPTMNMMCSDGLPVSEHLRKYTIRIEELKAQTGALYLVGLFERMGLHDRETSKKIYTAEFIWMMSQLKRAIGLNKEGRLHESRSPYQLLAAVQLGYLTERGAVRFDESSEKFVLNYDKFHAAVESLLRDAGQLYMRHDLDEVISFFDKYTKGEGLKMLHMDAIEKALSSTPVSVFRYDIKE